MIQLIVSFLTSPQGDIKLYQLKNHEKLNCEVFFDTKQTIIALSERRSEFNTSIKVGKDMVANRKKYQNMMKQQCSGVIKQKSIKELQFLYLGLLIQIYNNLILSLTQKPSKTTHKMNTNSSSQNQSSYQYSQQGQQPDLRNLINQMDQQIDPEVAALVSRRLAKQIKHAKDQKFDQCMNAIVKLIGKGYVKELVKQSAILQVMMDRFSQLCRQIQKDSKSQIKLMCLLSAIAQLIKQASHLQVSLKKGFLQNLLLIDQQLLGVSPIKRDILAVLGVLYECISRNVKALKKFQLLKQFKRAILANYSLIDQKFSSRLFNKALYNLCIQGEPITQAQLAKYGVFKTLIRLMGAQQAGILITKLKSALGKVNAKKMNTAEQKRTQMVAESS